MTKEQKKEFLQYLENLKIIQADDFYREGLDMAISALANSNVGMSMSHRAIAKVINDYVDNHRGDSDKQYTAFEIRALLISDDSAENKGEWIYDKNTNNWRCSICGQTLPPTGYVGKADFMATHFKFCPNCGADMRGE